MSRKRKKRKQKEPETVYYEIELGDWTIECGFGINILPSDWSSEDYSEDEMIIFEGSILEPIVKNANSAQVLIKGTPQFEDHWKNNRHEPPKATGWIDLPRGSDVLEFHGYFPSRVLPAIVAAAAGGKIRHATIRGTKLRYRKGNIKNVDLLTAQKNYGDE